MGDDDHVTVVGGQELICQPLMMMMIVVKVQQPSLMVTQLHTQHHFLLTLREHRLLCTTLADH